MQADAVKDGILDQAKHDVLDGIIDGLKAAIFSRNINVGILAIAVCSLVRLIDNGYHEYHEIKALLEEAQEHAEVAEQLEEEVLANL